MYEATSKAQAWYVLVYTRTALFGTSSSGTAVKQESASILVPVKTLCRWKLVHYVTCSYKCKCSTIATAVVITYSVITYTILRCPAKNPLKHTVASADRGCYPRMRVPFKTTAVVLILLLLTFHECFRGGNLRGRLSDIWVNSPTLSRRTDNASP